MFIESIRFKRTENSNWENGLYVGEYAYGSGEYIILENGYKPLSLADNGKPDCYTYESNEDNDFMLSSDFNI